MPKPAGTLPEPQEKIFKDFQAETEVKEAEGKRILVAKISTPTADRSNDRVFAKGCITKNFMGNPVVQFAHKYDELPIAKCTNLKISDTGILATVEFPEEGRYEKSDIIYWMYKNGYLNAWSIGFMPVEYEGNDAGGYDFKQWEMFEFSSVPVPDNPEALTVIRSKGIKVEALEEKQSPTAEEVEEFVKSIGGQAEDVPADEPQDAPEDEPAEEVKTTDEPEATEPTDDTKLADLTLAQLKDILVPKSIEQKDVSQVLSLSYVLSELRYIASVFEWDEVSEETRNKVNQAITLILEAIKDQAELGTKEFTVTDQDLANLPAITVEKATEPQLEQPVYVPLAKRLLTQIETTQKTAAKADRELGLTLKLLKQVKSGKGGENK